MLSPWHLLGDSDVNGLEYSQIQFQKLSSFEACSSHVCRNVRLGSLLEHCSCLFGHVLLIAIDLIFVQPSTVLQKHREPSTVLQKQRELSTVLQNIVSISPGCVAETARAFYCVAEPSRALSSHGKIELDHRKQCRLQESFVS